MLSPLPYREEGNGREVLSWLAGERLSALPFSVSGDGRLSVACQLAPGFYQFSVIADGRAFNWSELYFNLYRYGNQGQQTGPWDFNLLDANKPLVPSYWVFLNGERLGLWNFQRISLEDLEAKRFRGRMAFQVRDGGQQQLELLPYRSFEVKWMSARLESDPEAGLPPELGEGAVAFPDWEKLRRDLKTTHAAYIGPLERAFAWACGRAEHGVEDLVLLAAAWHLDRRPRAREAALAVMERLVAAPHWGNPREDGYGHNGDLGASLAFFSLAWAFRVLEACLPGESRQAFLDKLRLQGDRFVTQALLSRDYWGGSLLQDHGWRSMFRFGAATLYLRDRLPEARQWEIHILPRIFRALEAMPRDGAIPPSSYGALNSYLHDFVSFRDALVAVGGEDCLKRLPFRPVLDYIMVMAEGGQGVFVDGGIQEAHLVGGVAFVNHIASVFRDGRAAALSRRLLEQKPPEFVLSSMEAIYHTGSLLGFLSFDPSVLPVEERVDRPPLTFFEDSGLVHYRDDALGWAFAVRCGPSCGYHAYRRARGPCDRIDGVPGAGHFTIHVATQQRLVTPEFGYRMRSLQRSCLLIDGRGQYGDIGYPMSIPSRLHRGEEIESVRWKEQDGTGRACLQLGPAYPAEAGVISYTREFHFRQGREIVCRDQLLLERPRRLSWLFQGGPLPEVRLHGLQGRFGENPVLRVDPNPVGFGLEASIHDTEVVWTYSSAADGVATQHIRYDAVGSLHIAAIDFVITLGD
ncbi:MAG TPA: hypothetical protein VNQ90_07220 [Chthoniobacteraceae bacterium]|nr:hypothetical protein [Chthoniobacteraceae bacterium]